METLNSLNVGALPNRIAALKHILEEQNLLIKQYQENYQSLFK
jgi:hypothetical protein